MPSLGQHSKIARVLGQSIRIARVQKGWQQQRLAAEAHLSQKYLSQIEHGHVDPRWHILVQLSIALDPYLHLDSAAFETHREQQGLREEDARHA
jgi:transcriptional regulator with XRE-family HTH domain